MISLFGSERTREIPTATAVPPVPTATAVRGRNGDLQFLDRADVGAVAGVRQRG